MSIHSSISALSSVLDRIEESKRKIPRLSSIPPTTPSLAPAPSSSSSSNPSQTQTQTKQPSPTENPADNADASEEKAVEQEEKEEKEEKAVEEVEDTLERQVWYEFIDPASSKPYFHNYLTNETRWEPPAHFVPHNAYLGQGPAGAAEGSGVVFSACFNQRDGRFSSQSHWEQELERNREESRAVRQRVAQSKSGAEWAQFNKQKKEEKKRKRAAWLLDE